VMDREQAKRLIFQAIRHSDKAEIRRLVKENGIQINHHPV
jgi:hypothetical protein